MTKVFYLDEPQVIYNSDVDQYQVRVNHRLVYQSLSRNLCVRKAQRIMDTLPGNESLYDKSLCD